MTFQGNIDWKKLYTAWGYTFFVAVTSTYLRLSSDYAELHNPQNSQFLQQYYWDFYRYFVWPAVLDVVFIVAATQAGGRLARWIKKQMDGGWACLFSAVVYGIMAAPVFLHINHNAVGGPCTGFLNGSLIRPCGEMTTERYGFELTNAIIAYVVTFFIGWILYLAFAAAVSLAGGLFAFLSKLIRHTKFGNFSI